MKKIDSMIITRGFPPVEGGIETYMFQLANRWSLGDTCVLCDETVKKEKNNFNFEVKRIKEGNCSYSKAIKTIFPLLFFKSKHIRIAIKFFFLMAINRTFLIFIIPKLKIFVDEMKLRNEKMVIQCATHTYSGSIGLFGKIIFDEKLVVYIHGTELLKPKQRWNFNIFQKFILNNADLIISNSNFTKSIATKMGIPAEKIEVVNLGADINRFYPVDSKEKIYKKYNIDKQDKLLLSISHLIPRKGNDMVIKALPDIIQKIPNIKYMIGGEGRNKEKLIALTDDMNLKLNVIFVGYIHNEELNKYLNACDIFIMPNRKEGYDVEGFGIVFLEANACKKAVIAGNSGGAVDAVIDQKTGYLVDPLSIEDISEKVIKLLSDDNHRNEIGKIGYERVITELNWDKVIKKIERKIEDIYD
ncbi:MAG: glycosyltransferase family 4 protein [Candidatus Tenebribacter burtonii]|jgi:phosphatidylinositol alpha-1,6-mannosyltransferase|nr:glycosyltransferase family 4 protein [Candidatus Tenebribacter burtonii]